MMLFEHEYTDQHCQVQYQKYLDWFQKRYVTAFYASTHTTWRHIAFWRHNLNFFGGKLIERRLLAVEDHIRNKREVITKLEDGTEIDVLSVRETIQLY